MIAIISFLLIGITLLGLLAYGVNMLIKSSNVFGLLLFTFVYLSVYLTFQILLFGFFGNGIVLTINKLVKESVVFFLILFWVFSRGDLLSIRPNWKLPDYLMLVFLIVPLLFTVLPFGPATFVNKAIYFKGILMLGLMYFLGRVMVLSKYQIKLLINAILLVAISAFLLTLSEKLTDTHFQSLIPYEAYQVEVLESEPTGNYGLTWTFQATSGGKRFAAFFSNPLEMASVMLICGGLALYLWLGERNKVYRFAYSAVFLCTLLTLLISFSRASFAGFFLMLFLAAYLMGYWRIISITLVSGLIFLAGLFLFGGSDLQYFIIDTINFTESSSAGHIVDWVKAINSIWQSPQGIGLATSGNAGGVDPDLQVGGENQFLIFGVQMGLLYMFVYVLLLISVIRSSIRTFRRLTDRFFKAIPFVSAVFKFGFLVPLMTSNAEIYLFPVYFSWWAIGYAVSERDEIKNEMTKENELANA